jgi:UDP-MurNAc hydroxylase
MRLKFYGNAFMEVRTAAGKRIVCDPWILDGVYYGSWFHYPPVRIPPDFYEGVDYLFISHLHPDHLDHRSLRRFDRAIPVLISERRNPALRMVLQGLGFRNVTVYRPGEEHAVDGFRVRFWNDFIGQNVSRHDAVGFELDSSIAIFDDEAMVLNVNDNVPEPAAARAIRAEYPRIDCALLPYSGGGPYPQLFDNLSEEEKQQARLSVQRRFLSNFYEVARILEPDITVPVAGEYVIAGRNWECTRYLHTPSPQEIIDGWAGAALTTTLTVLTNLDELEIPGGAVTRANTAPLSYGHQDRIAYAQSKRDVSYLIDEFVIPDDLRLSPGKVLAALNKARVTLGEAQKRFQSFPQLRLVVDVPGTATYATDMGQPAPFEIVHSTPAEPYMRVTLPYAYLFALLTQHVHWNNLEIGNHVRLYRSPERYEPDIHVLLSFFHY